MNDPFDSSAVSLLLGSVGVATRVVAADDTAIAVGSGELPVLGTPVLIALMEAAACDALAGHLPPHLTSVGSHVNVRHVAPSPLGARVTARATITDVSGVKVTFDVSALHEIGDDRTDIGRGTHVRVVVDRDTFGHG